MTAKSVVFGRKAVILAVVISVAAMFVTSFMYRMDNPNLFVKGQQPSSMSGEGATPPPGMGQGGGMARVKEFMARVEENPNDVKALVNLGNSFLMMRAWDRALEPLEKANELKPGNTDVLKAIGIAYFNKEDFTKHLPSMNRFSRSIRLTRWRCSILGLFTSIISRNRLKPENISKKC